MKWLTAAVWTWVLIGAVGLFAVRISVTWTAAVWLLVAILAVGRLLDAVFEA